MSLCCAASGATASYAAPRAAYSSVSEEFLRRIDHKKEVQIRAFAIYYPSMPTDVLILGVLPPKQDLPRVADLHHEHLARARRETLVRQVKSDPPDIAQRH